MINLQGSSSRQISGAIKATEMSRHFTFQIKLMGLSVYPTLVPAQKFYLKCQICHDILGTLITHETHLHIGNDAEVRGYEVLISASGVKQVEGCISIDKRNVTRKI